MLIRPKALSHIGILGMNRRNVRYIGRYNSRHLFPLVDDKLRTKLRARKFSIPSPELRHVVRTQHDIRNLERLLEGMDGFAIKPSKGAGGKGILIVSRREGDAFIKPSGKSITLTDIKRHLSNIQAGLHSLAGTPDVGIIEDLIQSVPFFDKLSYEGVPDIRVIIFQGVPVMAMLRLATHSSDGKANLHQGAVGVGLDLATGQCAHAVQWGRRVTHHPDTGVNLDKIVIPDWRKMLRLAAECHDLTGLGYLGADLVVDRHRGPLLLELNARPGLAIQVANGAGLVPRLEAVETLDPIPRDPETRIDFAMRKFGVQPPCTTHP